MATSKKPQRELRRGDGYVTHRVTTTGETRYQARWNDEGSWRSKTFNTADEADDFIRNVGRSKRDGRYVSESTLTVNDALKSFMTRGKRRWKANTYSTYAGVVKYHIAPYIGSVRMVNLTPMRIQHLVDDLASKGLSTSVIENARTILNGACKDAMRLGVIPGNPVTGVDLPSRERTSYTVWNSQQVKAVFAACGDDLRMFTYYAIALTTAARPGEIRALKWADINLEQGRLTITRTVTRDDRGRQVLGTTTKTGRTRSIALPASTVAALKAWRKHQAERRLAAEWWRDLDLVLDRGDGHLLPQNTVTRAHQRIATTAGVPIIRLHDVRHTAASLLVEAGTHMKVVADILGHSSVSITMDTYSHPGESIQREATNLLGDLIDRHA